MGIAAFIRQTSLKQRSLFFLWTGALWLWPLPANLPADADPARLTASYGEGLYKSQLTEANSGLLGVRFFESFEGQKNWNIRSEFAELHRDQKNYAYLRNVDADFYSGGTGKNVVHTKSDFGRSYLNKRRVELEGNVIVRSQKGYRFMMDSLDYDGGPRLFHSDDLVQMVGPNALKPDMFLSGRGLDADLNQGGFVVRKNTRARRRLSNNEWLRVQSVRGEFFPDEDRAYFERKVSAVLPNLTIYSDGLEMSMGAGGAEVLKAHGNVVLQQKDRTGAAATAHILLGEDTIILEGNGVRDATIIAPDVDMHGSKITLHTGDDRIEVEQAQGSIQR